MNIRRNGALPVHPMGIILLKTVDSSSVLKIKTRPAGGRAWRTRAEVARSPVSTGNNGRCHGICRLFLNR